MSSGFFVSGKEVYTSSFRTCRAKIDVTMDYEVWIKLMLRNEDFKTGSLILVG